MQHLAKPTASLIGIALTICSILTPTSKTQELSKQPSTQPDVFQSRASSLIIPQSRAYALHPQSDEIEISEVSADVRILQQVATATIDIGLKNPSSQQREAEMLVPVPDGAVVRAFTFAGTAAEPTAKLLPTAEAQMLYRSIARRKTRHYGPVRRDAAGCRRKDCADQGAFQEVEGVFTPLEVRWL